MLIPLGFLAASGVSAGSYDLLETTILGSGQANVTFSNLNSSYGATYKHLQLRIALSALADRNLILQMNADTSTTYNYHGLEGTGSVVESFPATNTSNILIGVNPAGSNLASAGVIDILDAFSTNKVKVVRSLWGAHLNGASQRVQLLSGAWRSTNAITSLKIQYNASDLLTNSRFSLYGLKAA